MISGIRFYYKLLGSPGVTAATWARLTKSVREVGIRVPSVNHPIYVRVPSSDVITFSKVFREREYEFTALRSPRVIIDAGANIGLASIYFANRFPEARIVAVELEAENFRLLKKNIAPYPQITAVQAAIWGENGRIGVVDPGLGAWGFQAGPTTNGAQVPAVTIDALMDEHGIDRVDVLKMDIEGAEAEVFTNPVRWLDRVDSIVLELHDRYKTGCSRRFYGATNDFDVEWVRGENVFVSRAGCIAPAQEVTRS